MRSIILRFSGVLFVLLVWHLYASLAKNPAIISPFLAIESLGKLLESGSLLKSTVTTLTNLAIGYMVAAVFGVGLGILICLSRVADFVLTPLVHLMRPIAALTLFPMIIILLGIGTEAKAFVIFWTAWPAILLNTVYGIQSVDREIIEAAELDRAGAAALMLQIKVPLARPTVFTGLKIAISGGFIAIVSSEMLGGINGLGFDILLYSQTFKFPEMYAVIIWVAFLGYSVNWMLSKLQHILNLEKEGNNEKEHFDRLGDRALAWNLGVLRKTGTNKYPHSSSTGRKVTNTSAPHGSSTN